MQRQSRNMSEQHADHPFVCRVGSCYKACMLKESLRRHMRGAHGPVQYTCPDCGKGFLQKNEMERHREYHASYTDRKWKCDKCGKRFTNSQQLHRHGMSHKEVRIVCPFCDRTYNTKETLRCHMNDKHSTGAAAYKCRKCGKTFSTKNAHKKHIVSCLEK